MNKKATPVPVPAPCWFFRDRNGRRSGPYTDAKEIRGILARYSVGQDFGPAVVGDFPGTSFIMEDAEFNPVCPGDWLAAERERWYAANAAAHLKRHGQHVYRDGPVAGVHKSGYWKMWRTPNFGRKVRDTGYGCLEDGEPPIRAKLQVHEYAWDDAPSCRGRKNWKYYRQHQWRD